MTAPKVFYASSVVTLAATPTDVFELPGLANGVLKIRSLTISGSCSGTAGAVNAALIVRSAANTGGTKSALTAMPADSVSVSAAAPAVYTANASALGTAVGTVNTARQPFVTSTTLVTEEHELVRDAALLVAAGQYAVVALAGAAVPTGAALNMNVCWEEG